MSCNWGADLWDQFDSLEKHTGWGIEFLEKYTKFIRERAEIEAGYAKQIRSLSKKYHPKRSREDENSRFTWCAAFSETLSQLTELSNQSEALSESLANQCVSELTRFTQEIKQERKNHFQDGRRAQQHIESSWKQLESSKRRYERDCKEAERAQLICDRLELETKTEGEKRCSLKARHTAEQKKEASEESRREYLSCLNQFNQDQHQHYHTLVPVIYQRIQQMEERRIEKVSESLRYHADAQRKILPEAERLLEAMMEAAEAIQPTQDTHAVVQQYKSGFDPPGDVPFEDFSAIRRSVSESSYLDNRSAGYHDNRPPAAAEGRRQRGRLWPFIRKNKLLTLLASPHQPPPPPPTSPSPGGGGASSEEPAPFSREPITARQTNAASHREPGPAPSHREPITARLSDIISSGQRTRKHCLKSLKRGLSLRLGSGPADCSHLPPEQRRKKLTNRITNIQQDIHMHREKMEEVFDEEEKEEILKILNKLEEELQTNQAWLCEVEPSSSGALLTECEATNKQRESPDGSYTEDNSAELHFKSRSSEFDDDFDDEEPLQSIGTCKSLYPFTGQNEGTLSMLEGELLSVVEEDKGDGWTRVRRNTEEGYVPTSYIRVHMEPGKGFVHTSRLL